MLKKGDVVYVREVTIEDTQQPLHIVNGFGYRDGRIDFCYTLCELDFTKFDTFFTGEENVCPYCLNELRKIGTLGKDGGDE